MINRFRDTPIGRIRLSVPTKAAEVLVGPVLATFVERFPDIEPEISVSNRIIDVIDSGFDGGIRYGGTVPEDMIAQRLSADIRWIVVASPIISNGSASPAIPMTFGPIVACESERATTGFFDGTSSAAMSNSRSMFLDR